MSEKYKTLFLPKAEYLPGGFDSLCKVLDEAEAKKKKLRVKLGIDPTSTDLHIGHTVCLHILRKFQDLGHLPVLLIGGFTATVGDPSGRNEARPALTYTQVEENAKTYLDQVKKILDLNKVEIVNNFDWLNKLTLKEVIELAHTVTINQLIAKEAFGSRISNNLPLYLHEVLYPILQGYDSVQIKADIEIGGTDQKFNVLFGRFLQKHFNMPEQHAILLPLLIGLDGAKKMSKTFNNFISLKDAPNDVFGKTMSIPDEMIINYFQLVTDTPQDKINEYAKSLESGENPRNIKILLAHTLTRQIHSLGMADSSQETFIKQFSKSEIPEDIPEYNLANDIKITDLMSLAQLTSSKTEAKNLIQGGGVKLQGDKISDINHLITVNDKNKVLQIGKRKFLKLI